MMVYRAKKLGFRFAVLDASACAPAAGIADVFTRGGLQDGEALRELAAQADVLTCEIEHINTETLRELEEAGCAVRPSAAVLEVIQDKLTQKRFFERHAVPVTPCFAEDSPVAADLRGRRFPLVQKARREGYDGRAVRVLESASSQRLAAPSLFEERLVLDKELAVMAARGLDGTLALYPVAEMVFHSGGNILESVIVPARIGEETARVCQKIAADAVTALGSLGGVGVFGIELFLDKAGRLFLNEAAPRPHNSGHYTMEACPVCQFEQHLRAAAGLPLGSPRLLRPAVMLNLLGEPDAQGVPVFEGLPDALGTPGLSLHLYGKEEVRPLRKMGHATITADTLEEALEKADFVRRVLRVRGGGKSAPEGNAAAKAVSEKNWPGRNA
jgi:5-(carboxyamino)imidazole ribonucleotide synthase